MILPFEVCRLRIVLQPVVHFMVAGTILVSSSSCATLLGSCAIIEARRAMLKRIVFAMFVGGLAAVSFAYAQDAENLPDPDACTESAPEVCMVLGEYEMSLDKFSTPQGPRVAEALAYFEKACEGKSAKGCRSAADASRKLPKTYPGARDLRPALIFYKKACALDEAESCGLAGALALDQDAHDDNKPNCLMAETLWVRGCSMDDYLSCQEVSKMYSNGCLNYRHPNHVEKDLKKAEAYRDKICELGGRSAYCRYRYKGRGG
ncbi:MAG: hypothetical protein AAGA36_02520 [Pseudomonadota bacterium]